MKIDVLVAEIGSTTTLVNAFHNIGTDNPEFFSQGQAPTTVLEKTRTFSPTTEKPTCFLIQLIFTSLEY